MSMGCGANYAEVIEGTTILKMFPKLYQAFLDTLTNANLTFDEFARQCAWDEKSGSEEANKAFDELKSAFDKKTGLELCINYHDNEAQGDIYDEVNGGYFSVDGMYQLTPAGKKMRKKVERKFFVTFS